MMYHNKYVQYLTSKGGPDLSDYSELDAWICEINDQLMSNKITSSDIDDLILEFGESFSSQTMQGFAFHKPHGYAGDFEIIDRIYLNYISEDKNLSKWDKYWQSLAAPKAVRNRNVYFSKTIKEKTDLKSNLKILNLASGPGRDMYSFFLNNPDAEITIDCVEQDKKAIQHAKDICIDYLDKINFIEQNVLKLNIDNKYDVIWSAGLFDYFNDKVFCYVLNKLIDLISDDGGEIIIGNFSTFNPSKNYMKLLQWNLEHRSPQRLIHLAEQCGIEKPSIQVKCEDEKVNLFLHLNIIK